ncbi:alpha/beta fold hydrolase [Actinomadura chibensis]|uniref:Alpha/beta hydrolase n=1 Tax=Actinomadura chibensis TaxID=392828 RepID=A0A5D0NCW5_9ACTN|nr:alpha/beta hydrolase [Actinomadura chibensis]TYB42163.1 alpha/beta hydrolase [Actinomadura chibensis]
MSRSVLRRVSGALLLLAAAAAAPLAGVAGFFGLAAVTADIPLLAVVGLLVVAGTGLLVGLPAFALLGVRRRRGAALLLGAALTAAVAAVASLTVFRPGSLAPTAAPPAGVRFWNLPTGSRIAYVHAPAAGKPRPTPVVFLHGGPGTPGEGLPTASAALTANGFDVYAYDQVGAGRSTRLSDVTGYTVARHVADLDAIRAAIGADKIIIVGQSWGGSLAAQYLAAHPEHVAKVAFTSPGALWPSGLPDGDADPKARLDPAKKKRYDELTSSPRLLAAALLLGVNPNAAHALVGDREADERFHELGLVLKDVSSCPGAPPRTPHENRQGFYVNQVTSRDFEHVPDPRPALRRVRVPALIMRGQCDYVRWEATRDYRRTLPDSTLVMVKGAGHAIAGDQPAVYTDLLRAFLLDRRLPLPAYTSDDPPR